MGFDEVGVWKGGPVFPVSASVAFLTRTSAPDLPDQPAPASRPQGQDADVSERAGGGREGGGRRGRKVRRQLPAKGAALSLQGWVAFI